MIYRSIDKIEKINNTADGFFDFTILIPTWNQLEHLHLLLESLRENSKLKHQIILIVNEGSDGTRKWALNQADYDVVISPENIGVCLGLNSARSLVKSKYLVYMNDDMFVLPGWDVAIQDCIHGLGTKAFMISGTMIEPKRAGGANHSVVSDFGSSVKDFRRLELMESHVNIRRSDWQGSTWPPNVMHIDVWDLVGGMSIEFSPGLGSDPDLSRKLYAIGVREFIGLGSSQVYHFMSKSTHRIIPNDGRRSFLLKWEQHLDDFVSSTLKRGIPYDGPIERKPSISPRWKVTLRIVKYLIKNLFSLTRK